MYMRTYTVVQIVWSDELDFFSFFPCMKMVKLLVSREKKTTKSRAEFRHAKCLLVRSIFRTISFL